MKENAPIAIFAYNRPAHFEKTIAHLRINDMAKSTKLYVFLDGAKSKENESRVQSVKKVVNGITGFSEVVLVDRVKNWGLLRSMVDGVSMVSEKHGRVIVIEDDVITTPYFLRYINNALDYYEKYRTVGSVTGYTVPYVTKKARLRADETFFHYRVSSQGWATWWNRWNKVDWEPVDWRRCINDPEMKKKYSRGGMDMVAMLERSMQGKNQSWMARWYYHCFLHGMLTLYPGRALVDNIGFDGSGTHSSSKESAYKKYRTCIDSYSPIQNSMDYKFKLPVSVEKVPHRCMVRFYKQTWLIASPIAVLIRPIYRCIRRLFSPA